MNQPLAAYIEWIELMTFFPGYLIVFALVFLWAGRQGTKGMIRQKIMPLLPLSYALVATLYWGLILKNWYPGYEMTVIKASIYHPVIRAWGMLGVMCWIPYIYKRPFFSLLHSMVFFALLLRDLLLTSLDKTADNSSRNNDLKIYGASIAINLGALLVIIVLSVIIKRLRKNSQDQPGSANRIPD